MRARASLAWRVAMAVAFAGTAVLAVILSRGAPVNAALASDKGGGGALAQPAAVTAGCAVAGLRISLGAGARVTTAITRYALEFTNVSRVPCTLAGYPQVAAYRGDGVLVSPAAARDTSVVARRVLLAPGQSAHAVLDATVPVSTGPDDAGSAARCRPVRASGLRVVTPGQTAARYVMRPLTTCAARAAHGQSYLLVRAIQPGTGTSAGGAAGTLADVRPRPGAARVPSPPAGSALA